MQYIGLTGGIGAGKSFVAQAFQAQGYPIYEADREAKRLMEADEKLREKIAKLFGEESYRADGSLNRQHIADQVFNSPNQLSRLNSVVHPAVRDDFYRWAEATAAASDKPFLIKEAAIIYEAKTESQLDAVMLVSAPRKYRVQRIRQRDEATREDALARMSRQWPEHTKRLRAEFIIYNDGRHAIAPQVQEAIRFFSEDFQPQQAHPSRAS